jgi:hypothetical protein
MRFARELHRLEHELDLPYPERADLLAEIAADLDAAFDAARRRGLSEDKARAAALRELTLDRDALAELHRPPVQRILSSLRPRARMAAEWSVSALPLALTLVYLFVEVPMLDFVQQGGFASLLILAVGGLAVLAAARRAFLWLVARNHAGDVLGLDDGTPLALSLLTFLIGVAGTGCGAYKVLTLWQNEEIDGKIAVIGFKESLVPVVMAASFAVLALSIDLFARTMLRRTGAPRVVPRP